MKKALATILLIFSFVVQAQQLYVGPDAIFYISPGSNVEVTGDLENEGTILNTGTLSLYGDWEINNIFNGNTGDLVFLGGQDQMVFSTVTSCEFFDS